MPAKPPYITSIRVGDQSPDAVRRFKGIIVMNRLVAPLIAFGLVASLIGCSGTPGYTPAAAVPPSTAMAANDGISNPAEDPDVPGATGRVIVPGNNSTINGDYEATVMQRTGAL
jgi:hypothetical protein